MSVIGIGRSPNRDAIGQMMSRMQTRGSSTDGVSSAGAKEKPDLSQLVAQLDTDSSGSLESGEIQNLADAISGATGVSVDLEEFLTTYNTDGVDGLSQEEAVTALAANPPQGPPPSGGMARPDESDMVSSADTNEDSVISEEEAASLVDIINTANGSSLHVEDFLSEYDTDGEEGLSTDEAIAAMEANRPEGPPPEDKGMTAAALETYMAMSAMGSQNTGDLLTTIMGDAQESVHRMA
ncbi:hypothetical protein [Desulfobulbus propionicus]